MNFLAHAYLSDGTPAGLLGSVMGDFVKGPLDGRYDAAITQALLMHRRVDSYTDAHPVVAGSRARIKSVRRRFAGILVDMFYDHFLARHWSRYANVPLDHFTARLYAILLEHRDALPERLQRIAPHMAQTDWLGCYGDLDAMSIALDRLGGRLKRGNALLGSARELVANYAELDADFAVFFPDLVRFVRGETVKSAG